MPCPPRLRPKTPAMINAMLINLSAVTHSRKYTMPMVAIAAVPMPAQIAKAMLTSIVFCAIENATNEHA